MNKREILTGPRQEKWEWKVLDVHGNWIDTLEGVEQGQLSWSIGNTIRGGGSLTYGGVNVDWLKVMLKPVYSTKNIYGLMEWPLGVFIPSTPGHNWKDTGHTEKVQLYDKLQILDQDKLAQTYGISAGSSIQSEIQGIIPADELQMDDTNEKASADIVWDVGTSKLEMVNDLLSSINYFSVWVDGDGQYRCQNYLEPQDRSVTWEFKDDYEGIYDSAFKHQQDLFDIPNKVVEITSPDENENVWIATAVNVNPNSPSSYGNRGRWITKVDQGVEASSQSVLQARANRRLRDLTNPAATLEIKHALIPMTLNDLVTFRRSSWIS